MIRPKQDWRRLYPQSAANVWDTGNFKMNYLDQGTGPVILCVHGNPTWSFYYREIVKKFSDQYRVIAVDHVGCGLSSKPSRNEFDYTLATHRDNLVGLIDHLNLQNITLVAHDWGGAIGLAAAVQRIERLSSMMLMNTAAFPPPYMPKRIGILRTPILGTAAIRGLNAFARPAVTMATARHRLAPDVASGLLFPYQSWGDRVAIDAFVRDIPMSSSHPTHPVLVQLERDLVKLKHLPVQLIWGMKDWCFRPECLERFLHHWPDANVARLDDVGHYVLEDAPDETLSILRSFLQSHRP